MITIIEIHGLVLPPLVLASSIGRLSIRQKILSVRPSVTLSSLILVGPDPPVVAYVSVDGGIHASPVPIAYRLAEGVKTLKARIKCVTGDNVWVGDVSFGWVGHGFYSIG